MNKAATIMQSTDWTRFKTEDWFRQFGAWMNGNTETKKLVYKSLPSRKLNQKQREELIAKYMSDESIKEPCIKKGMSCQINDNEARAFQRIILDIREIKSEPLQEWMDAVWQVFVENKNLREVAQMYATSTIQIRFNIKCALAFISGRYPNLRAEIFKI
ncbi:hypothetical protein DBL02_12765 [Acinetobacter oleivorans]|uniref:hypothetical protein n=1 Tax=Acinetobacter oleivorans TaxID=1148157 RepID=UPI000D326AD0|nr:hypothetical protein [Acinetobacter oleivorans]PTV44552.1 hypothetical protein DBL02_12765 [Acinetobacter oleivorans]